MNNRRWKIWMGICLCAFVVLGLGTVSFAQSTSYFVQIRRQFVEYHAAQPVDDQQIQGAVDSLSATGQWPDINYVSTRKGNWEAWDHMTRTLPMAAAYVNPSSCHYQQPAVRSAILRALQYWLDHDYRNENWWYARIGIPEPFLMTLLLLGDDAPAQLVADAKPLCDRSTMGMTGQNKVWCAGIALMKGVVYDEPELVVKAASSIWEEVRVSTEAGIQPDWSFHQHGAQLQLGNYGLWFGQSVVLWASALRDTPYALAGESLDVLRNYLLNGPAWVLWEGRFDLGACARQVDAGCQLRKGAHLEAQLKNMSRIDPDFSAEYEQRIIWPNVLVGCSSYPRSDFFVQRRATWTASLKMSSSRIIGSENTNSENGEGLHLSDGMLLLSRTGTEYEDIQPLWDWKRLPGTTCDQGLTHLRPIKKKSLSSFAGSLTDGTIGLAAMVYQRGELTAHKSWFFGIDQIVCLGAGIGGPTAGSAYTSIQQSHLNGPVESSIGTVAKGTHTLPEVAWIHHDGVGYILETDATVQIGPVNGNWEKLFPTRGDRPATGDVFSLWIDHGAAPKNARYAYCILPQTQASEMDKKVAEKSATILSNTEQVQAVEVAGSIQAVFYNAGMLTTPEYTIKVNAPCLVLLQGDDLYVSDPLQLSSALTITIDQRAVTVTLSSGNEAGSAIRIRAADWRDSDAAN